MSRPPRYRPPKPIVRVEVRVVGRGDEVVPICNRCKGDIRPSPRRRALPYVLVKYEGALEVAYHRACAPVEAGE